MLNARRSVISVAVLAMLCAPASAADVVNVYSYRQPTLIDPLLARFKAETGIDVRSRLCRERPVERMVQEGANSPVDVLLTADVGRPGRGCRPRPGAAGFIRGHSRQGAGQSSRRKRPVVWTDHAGPVIYASNERVKQAPSPMRNWRTRNGRERSAAAGQSPL